MIRHTLLPIFGVLAALILVTTGVFLYAQGYRLDFGKHTLTATGVILAKSLPDGAKVTIDGELTAVTNSPISDVTPGTHRLKIAKDGFFAWEKEVEVKAGLVTEASALLPPLSPSLTAVTQEGARLVTRSPSGTKAAYLSKNKIYLLSLTNQLFGFLRTSPQEVGEETADFPFAAVNELLFSPDEDQILVLAGTKAILFTLGTSTPSTVSDPAPLVETWSKTTADRGKDRVSGLGIPKDLSTQALDPSTSWSPDEKKFLYFKMNAAGKREFWVADFTSPLPIGENKNQKIWETDPTSSLKLFWLADSEHFIMLENGTVSLIDLDGSNKHDLFKGALAEPVALSSSDLSRIIIITSLSPTSPPNLYAIGLR